MTAKVGRRKPRGLGTIVERKDGRFMVQLDLGRDADGRRRRLTRYAPSKAEANRVLRELIRSGEGAVRAAAPGGATLAQVTAAYLERKRERLAPATWAQYESLLRNHVLSLRGDMAIGRVERKHVVDLYAHLERKGVSARTRAAIYAAAAQVFGFAVAEGLIDKSPQDGVDKPGGRASRRERPKAWTVDEARAFLAAAREVTPTMAPLFELILGTGFRISEALGLRWRYVDTERRRLTVAGQWTKRDGYAPTAKSSAGMRTVVVDEELARTLDAIRPADASLDDYVFRTRTGRGLNQDNVRHRYLRPAVDAAGVPNIGLHGLRHTHASLLLAKGVNPKAVSARLGHENVTVTLQMYAHVMPGEDEAAAQTLAGLLGGRGASE